MADWKDVTSYSQSSPRGTAEPKSWELAGSSPRIVVTRYLGAPGWYLRTEGLDLVHLGEDLERAKAEAVRLVRERLTRMLDSLPPSDPWRPIEECGELEEGEIYLVGWRGHDPHEARVWTWTDGIWEDEEGYEQQPPDYIHSVGPIRGPGETT